MMKGASFYLLGVVLQSFLTGSSASVSPDGTCGPRSVENYSCVGSSFGDCCSNYGWCGSTSDFCAAWNCQSGNCVAPVIGSVSPDGTCGRQSAGNYTCVGSSYGSCCSNYGWCGSTSDYCAAHNCQSGNCNAPVMGSVSPDGTCGPQSAGHYTCVGSSYGSCCSVGGWCGSTSDFCGAGNCLSGNCVSSASTTFTSTSSTSISTTSSTSTSTTSSTSTSTTSSTSTSTSSSTSTSTSSSSTSTSTSSSTSTSTTSSSTSTSTTSSSTSTSTTSSSTSTSATSSPTSICTAYSSATPVTVMTTSASSSICPPIVLNDAQPAVQYALNALFINTFTRYSSSHYADTFYLTFDATGSSIPRSQQSIVLDVSGMLGISPTAVFGYRVCTSNFGTCSSSGFSYSWTGSQAKIDLSSVNSAYFNLMLEIQKTPGQDNPTWAALTGGDGPQYSAIFSASNGGARNIIGLTASLQCT